MTDIKKKSKMVSREKNSPRPQSESEKKYRTIFENTGAATILIGEDTTILMVNSEFEKLSGLPRKKIERVKSWQEFIDPVDVNRMLAYHYMRRAHADTSPRNYQCRLINRKGESRVCHMTVALIPDTKESVASLLDITEMIEAREALAGSEERYRLLVETMNDGLGVQDESGRITYVNQQIVDMIGFSREKIIGKTVLDFLHEDYHDIWRNSFLVEGHNQPFEVGWKKKDGEIIYTIVSPRPIYGRDGNFSGSFAVFTDITERKNAEEAVRQSEEKFSKAFRSSPDAITITKLVDGVFTDVNESFLRITGYGLDEIIGRSSVGLRLWRDKRYRDDLIAAVKKDGSIHNREIEFYVKSGEKRFGLYSAEVIRLGGDPYLLSSFSDITDQKRLGREILAISEKERRNIGQDLHDDLQQHLIGIEALASLLEGRLRKISPQDARSAEEIRGLVSEAVEKTRRMARGLCPIYLNENAIVPAIRDFAGNISEVFGVDCTFASDRKIIIRDNTTAVHLYNIIQESVNNAIRHGRAKKIAIRLRAAGGRIYLTVEDNGKGIGAALKTGEGLGINIMKYRAAVIGATLEIVGRKGGGTTVSCVINQK